MTLKVNLDDYSKNRWYNVIGVLMAFRAAHSQRIQFYSRYTFFGEKVDSPRYFYIFWKYFTDRKECLDALVNDLNHPL